MGLDLKSIGRAFAPRMINKAMQTFDNASMVIVSICWGGALVVMMFAMYTVQLSVDTKKDVVEAMATQPSLPVMKKKKPKSKEIQPIVDRLQRHFPKVNFNLGRDLSLTVSATDGNMFRKWLTILSYIDTISPEYRWEIVELCVGMKCPGSVPMKAVLAAKKVTFQAPKLKKRDER